MTLKVMLSDVYKEETGRTISLLISHSDYDLIVKNDFYDLFGHHNAKNAELWAFSYEHKSWPILMNLLPKKVLDIIDDIAHDMPTQPTRFRYFAQYHVCFS